MKNQLVLLSLVVMEISDLRVKVGAMVPVGQLQFCHFFLHLQFSGLFSKRPRVFYLFVFLFDDFQRIGEA